MATITIPKSEYQNLIQRQFHIEKELNLLKKILTQDNENYIYPYVLKRWENISHNLDQNKGRSFTSVKIMKEWLKSI